MRFEFLEYLLEIDRCRSLSKAAKNLYVTQPALSAAVNSMEMELGFTIFKRSNTGVTPTNNGERIIADARIILNMYREWVTQPIADGEIRGNVCVAASPSVCKTVMISIVKELQRTSPKLNVTVLEVMVKDMLDHMKTHQSSIGIMGFPDAMTGWLELELRGAGYVTRRVSSEKMKCILNVNHPLAQKSSLNSEDLKLLSFVTYADSSDPTTAKILEFIPAECTRYRVSSDEMIRNMVAMNMAATIGPEISGQSMQYDNHTTFKFLSIEGYDDETAHILITPTPDEMSSAERKFVETSILMFNEYIT